MVEIGGFEYDWKWLKAKLIKHFLPLGLLTALILSLAWPYPGAKLSGYKAGEFRILQTLNVCTIFFVSGMTIKTEDVKDALKAGPSLAYGLVSILLITPLLGFLTQQVPFDPKEFRIGLTLFICMPTTLTSGVTMVTAAKGNPVLALILTCGSNLLGVISVPFMIRLVLQESDVRLDPVQLLAKLALTILLPLALGKTFRECVKQVPAFCTRNKTILGMVNNGSLVMIVWQTCSRSSANILDQTPSTIFPIIAGGVIVHAIFFTFNGVVTEGISRAGYMPWKERKSVWLLASQKTLPVAMTILTYLKEEDVGDHGLVAIPMIIGHMSQLFIDSYISLKWAEWAALEATAKSEGTELLTGTNKEATPAVGGSDGFSEKFSALDEVADDEMDHHRRSPDAV